MLTTLLIAALGSTAMATTYDWTGATSSAWEIPTNWNPNGNPGSAVGDVVQIGVVFFSGSQPTLSVGPTNALASITLGTASNATLTISTVITVTITGLVTINTGSTWIETAAATPVFRGGITNSGTFTASTGVHTFSTNAQALSGTISIPSVTVTAITLTNNGTLTVGTALAGTGALTNGATSTLNIGGTCGITTFANAGMTAISGSGNITTALANFTNTGTLNVNGSGTITGITNNANGIVNLSSSGTIGTFTNATATSTLNISVLGVPPITTLTVAAAGNTVNYSGAGDQTVKDVAYSNLITSGGTGIKTWTEGAARVMGSNLTIGDGTTLSVAGAYAFTVTGTTTIGSGTSGTLSITDATFAKTFTGVVTINAGGLITETVAAQLAFGNNVTITGTLAENGAALVSIAGNLTNNGTYTASTGVHTFSGAAKTIGGNSTNTIPSATFTGSYTNNGTLTVGTVLTGGGTLTNAATFTLNIGGTCSITTLTNNGIVNSSGTGTITSTTVTNNLTWNMSGTGTVTAFTNSATGVLNISSSPVPTFTTLTVSAAGNTVNYTLAGDQTIKDVAYSNLITSGGTGIKTWTETAARVMGSNLTIGDGTTLSVAGAYAFTVTGTTTIGTGTSGTLSITDATFTKTFTGAVTINAGGVITETVAAQLSFGNNLTNNGTYTASTGVHTFSGAAKTIGGSNTISSATFTGTYTNNGTLTVGTALTGGGTLTNAATSTLNIGGACSISTLTNNGIVNSSGTGTITSTTITNNLTWNMSGTGTVTAFTNSATGVLYISALPVPTITTLTVAAAGNTVNYNGAGDQTVKDVAYSKLITSGSGTKTWTEGAARVMGSNLTIGDGTTLSIAGAFALTVTGTTTIGSGTSGTLSITDATFAKTFTGVVTINTGGLITETVAAQLAFGNNVTINAGGTITENGAALVSIAGNLTNNGAYTASTGVHTFSGAAKTIGGNSTNTIPSAAFTGTYTNNGTLTVGTALTGGGTLTNAATFTLNIGGACGITNFANAGTTFISGSGNITTALAKFINTDTLNLGGSGTIVGITNNANGIVNLSSSGTIGTFTNATASSTLYISVLGVPPITTLTVAAAGNTVNYNGAGDQTVKDVAYSNLITSGGTGIKTWTEGAARVMTGSLSIGDATTLTVTGGSAFTVNGTTTIGTGTSGTLTLANVTGAKTFIGLVTISVGAIWNETAAVLPTIEGGITNSGTFTASTGVHTFNTNSQALTGTFTIPSVTVTTVTLTNNGSLTVGTALAGTGTLTNSATGTLNIGGTSTITTLTATAAGNTVNYNGTGAQTLLNTNYDNLTISGARTSNNVTINGAIGVSGTFTNGATFSTGNFVLAGSTFTLNGAGAQPVSMLNGVSYANLTLSGGGTKTFAAAITTTGNLTIGSGVVADLGTFSSTSNTLWLGGAGQLSGTWGGTGSSASNINTTYFAANTGIVTVAVSAGTWTGTASTDWNDATNWSSGFVPTSSTDAAISSTANQPIIGAVAACRNLAINIGATATNNSALTLTGSLAGAGTFVNSATGTLNINFTGTVGITTLTATASGNTVNYGFAGTQTVKAVTYSNLGLSGSGAKTMTGVTTIGSDFNMSGSATATPVITTVGGNVNISGTAVMTTGANISITGSLNVGGGSGFTSSGTFTVGAPTIAINGTYTAGSTGTVTGNMTVGAVTGVLSLGAVTSTLTGNFTNNHTVTGTTGQLNVSGSINNNNPGTITLTTGRITQTGSSDFTNGGTITLGAGRLSLSGNFTNTGTLTLSSAQVLMVGTGSGSYNVAGFTTGLVTVSAAAGTYTFTGNVSCAGITISGTAVTLNLGAGLTHTSSAAVAISAAGATLNGGSSTLTISFVGAAFTGTGTFTAGTGTVKYSGAGAQTCLATTYNNLTVLGTGVKTFATTPAVNGILSMEGTSASITVTSGAVTYGANATLQYNKTAAFTATAEWISPFAATGGIIIKNTGTITTAAAETLNAGVPLTINASAILATGATNTLTLTVGGITTVNGTLTLANTATKTFTGAVTIYNGGAITETAGAQLIFGSDVIINSGGSFTENTTATDSVSGNWTNNGGTFTPGSSTIVFNGSTTQYINGSATTQTFSSVTISGSGGVTVGGSTTTLTIAGAMSITSSATLEIPAAHALTFSSGASISTGTGKIILDDGADYINLSGSSPTLQMKRAITGTEGWRMLAAPNNVTVSSMFASPFVTQGFSGSTVDTLQPNLLWWDETDQGTSQQSWRQPSSSSDTVKLGRGYMYYAFNGTQRPDEVVNYTDALPLTMSALGTENPLTTAFDFGVTATPVGSNDTSTSKTFTEIESIDAGWNLVGNPTPSTIDWNASLGWTKTNMDGTIYIWNPADTVGGYKTWNGTTGNLGSGKIAPFQAFWVKANDASPQLTCTNSVKSTGGSFLGKTAKDSTSSPPVLSLALSANGLQAQAYVMFSHGGKVSYDPYDAFSLVPLSDKYLILYSVAGEGQPAMQIQDLPDAGFAEPFTLPLYVGGTVGGQPISGSFVLRWDMNGSLPAGWKILLMDDVAGKAYTMTTGGELTFAYNTPADLAPPSSSVRGKKSGHANIQRALSMLSRPVVHTVPASRLSKSASGSRFRVVISGQSNLGGYFPSTPELSQNYPNPFNPTTNIAFSVPSRSHVTIDVFNVLGQKVTTVTDQEWPAGNHLALWTARGAASGVYFCRMITDTKKQTIKMVLVR